MRRVQSKDVQCVERWVSFSMCQVPKDVSVEGQVTEGPRGCEILGWDPESVMVLHTLNAASPIRLLSWILYYICRRKLEKS